MLTAFLSASPACIPRLLPCGLRAPDVPQNGRGWKGPLGIIQSNPCRSRSCCVWLDGAIADSWNCSGQTDTTTTTAACHRAAPHNPHFHFASAEKAETRLYEHLSAAVATPNPNRQQPRGKRAASHSAGPQAEQRPLARDFTQGQSEPGLRAAQRPAAPLLAGCHARAH